jgi:PAS domain S-box-containing protein
LLEFAEADITDRKRAGQINSRLAAIVETSDDAIISKDLNGIIQSWNAGATRLFGYTADEAIGRSITMLMPPERVDEEPGILERIRRGDRIDHYETIRRCKDGKLVDISLTVSPITDERGKIVAASKIARDITDRKRAERALLEADRQKNEFLATLAHELRNPLAPIRNSLNVLRLTRGDVPAAERVRETMERQVNHLVRLVDDLLDIARITAGKLELRREPTEIASIIRSAVETSRPLIDAQRHQLSITLPAQPLTVEADPVRLSQVVANLLNNAAKYTESGGQIWLTVSCEAGEVVISVRDTGIGIRADMLPVVMDMFTRTDRGRTHSQDGLGIGLALVKRLVELHGGRVEATSEGDGRGSEFTVRLRLFAKQLPAVDPGIPVQSDRPIAPRQRVLVVDDNQDAATSLAMLLRILGSDVETAHDGRSALQAFVDFRPSVVLLDLGMPDMNGYEVARRLRELPQFEKVTLVALTGWGQEDDRRKTHEAGFDEHMVKPVNVDALQVLLADVQGR